MSVREDVITNVIDLLGDMTPPKPAFVTREPFDLEKLSLRQFPALLITTGNELREDIAMSGIREGTITVNITGYVRSDGREGIAMSVDEKRNNLIERIEETLNAQRNREVTHKAVRTQVREINVVERTPPLGEFTMAVEVKYIFTKGEV
jgi:hypothetical protein